MAHDLIKPELPINNRSSRELVAPQKPEEHRGTKKRLSQDVVQQTSNALYRPFRGRHGP